MSQQERPGTAAVGREGRTAVTFLGLLSLLTAFEADPAAASPSDAAAGTPSGPGQASPSSPPGVIGSTADPAVRLRLLEQRVAALEQELLEARRTPFPIRLPRKLTLCGEEVPLDDPEVLERVEREVYSMLGDEATVLLWIKRSARAFPVFEEVIREERGCDDVKYVAVIESGLRPYARSWAGAVGPWQFIRSTGREQGLVVGRMIDERQEITLATRAAVGFLQDLYRRFGSWALAFAAYNMGPAALERAMREQGGSSYYDLLLPTEADRYVPRVAAAKIILEDPARYGFDVPPEERYREPETQVVTLVVPGEGYAISTVAAATGTSFRRIRLLNPKLTGSRIPAGIHEIRLPAGARADRLDERLRKAVATSPKDPAARSRRTPSPARAERVRRHRVSRGEALWDIARRYDVTVQDLARWNRLSANARLVAGQTLVVRED